MTDSPFSAGLSVPSPCQTEESLAKDPTLPTCRPGTQERLRPGQRTTPNPIRLRPGGIAAQIDGLPLAEQPPAPDVPAELPKVAACAQGRPMRHLMTNVDITAVERKIDIDFFAEAQIRAPAGGNRRGLIWVPWRGFSDAQPIHYARSSRAPRSERRGAAGRRRPAHLRRWACGWTCVGCPVTLIFDLSLRQRTPRSKPPQALTTDEQNYYSAVQYFSSLAAAARAGISLALRPQAAHG